MLDMRPNCEICDRDLPANSQIARICSLECTFCSDCHATICPNCGGDLQIRPTRAGDMLKKYPASTKRVNAS